ncbi:ribonuclease P/MRP protein subunit Rpp1p [Trichomonascus vanleenenianus]|uniref:RNA-binding RNA processing protein RPP1 n=1 Tax=Trichomonascus vanleenenianus TaxID=2268995 RepID=UPI003EC9F9D2
MAASLGYSAVALAVVLSKIPKNYESPITADAVAALRHKFPQLQIYTRVTVVLDDSTQNQNFQHVFSMFDIVAVRPHTEKALQSAATALDIDLISLDMAHRLPFFLKFKTVCAGVDRGVKFEICYAAGGVKNPDARRHVITNAQALIRASRRRGLVISSEAPDALSLRSPHDITNLAGIWGLDHMRARDSVAAAAEEVVLNAQLRAKSYKQVVLPV